MIGRQKNEPIGHRVFGAVAKFILALARDQFFSLQVIEIGFEPDSSQGNDDAQIFQSLQFALQKRSAVGQFLGQRLVVGRGACDLSTRCSQEVNSPFEQDRRS
jgi:hypothetical protein